MLIKMDNPFVIRIIMIFMFSFLVLAELWSI